MILVSGILQLELRTDAQTDRQTDGAERVTTLGTGRYRHPCMLRVCDLER